MGEYVKIQYGEFKDAIEDQKVSFREREPEWTKEYIYERLFRDKQRNEFVLRVYSSIDRRDNEARDRGDDAIRAVMLYRNEDRMEKNWSPLFKEKRTNRTPGWDRRLTEKINTLVGKLSEVNYCDRCGRVMVLRTKDGDHFYGCTGWAPNNPACTNTEPYDE